MKISPLYSISGLLATVVGVSAQNAFVAEVGASKNSYYGSIPAATSYQLPGFRWWMPGGWVDGDELRREITEVRAAGFGRLEISDVEDSIKNGSTLPPQKYGWAQPRWNNAILGAYEQAQQEGLHLDYTIGPHWPTGFPGYTPDSPATMKELVHGQVLVQSGSFNGALPLPIAAPSGQETANPNVTATPFLVAVLAAKTTATNVNDTVIDFDPTTVLDLTSPVQNNRIDWTAPSSGSWILVAAYGRGTGQIENMYDGTPTAPKIFPSGPGLIVDHFSRAGVTATTNFWETHILTPELKTLMASVNASYFEDSLELKLKQYWTLNMTTEFEARRGYSLIPYLLYLLQDTNTFSGNVTINTAIQADWVQTVTDLYVGYRLEGLQGWANTFGMSALDNQLEGESLGFNTLDQFRLSATGRDVAGHTTILSDELGANFGEAYYLTWRDLLQLFNEDASVGVTQAMIHGHPYRDSPTSQWPGFAPFTPLFGSPGFADAWGSRQPQWLFATNASYYMANAQSLLQGGSPSIDVAILNTIQGDSIVWTDPALNLAGYSYQFPSPTTLLHWNAKMSGKTLGNPAYKAMILNNQTGLNLDISNAIYKYAKQGLPIVIVGVVPHMIQGYSNSYTQDNAKVAALFTRITALPTTKVVATEADVPAALASLGVQPSVRYSDNSSTFFSQRRNLGKGKSLYFIYNDESTATVSQVVSLAGSGYPMALDLWAGKVIPIPVFTPTADGYIQVNVTLTPGSAQVIFVGEHNPYGATQPKKYILSATGQVSVTQVGDIALRALTNGTYSATLNNGKTKTFAVDGVGTPVIPEWTLTVQDWNPQTTGEVGLQSSHTKKTMLKPVNLGQNLTTWGNIESLQHAGGIGYYTATVTLAKPSEDEQKGPAVGVYFDVGTVYGTFGVTVNGNAVQGIDQFTNSYIEITDYVINGLNSITITLATPLWNKLQVAVPSIWGNLPTEQIGLVGPVVLRYYKEVIVV